MPVRSPLSFATTWRVFLAIYPPLCTPFFRVRVLVHYALVRAQIVVDANEMLVRMTHRGACGCEENTGDGAGILVAVPDGFLRKAALEAGIGELPAEGEYAVGNIFVPKFENAVPEAKAIVERVCKQRGMKVTV